MATDKVSDDQLRSLPLINQENIQTTAQKTQAIRAKDAKNAAEKVIRQLPPTPKQPDEFLKQHEISLRKPLPPIPQKVAPEEPWEFTATGPRRRSSSIDTHDQVNTTYDDLQKMEDIFLKDSSQLTAENLDKLQKLKEDLRSNPQHAPAEIKSKIPALLERVDKLEKLVSNVINSTKVLENEEQLAGVTTDEAHDEYTKTAMEVQKKELAKLEHCLTKVEQLNRLPKTTADEILAFRFANDYQSSHEHVKETPEKAVLRNQYVKKRFEKVINRYGADLAIDDNLSITYVGKNPLLNMLQARYSLLKQLQDQWSASKQALSDFQKEVHELQNKARNASQKQALIATQQATPPPQVKAKSEKTFQTCLEKLRALPEFKIDEEGNWAAQIEKYKNIKKLALDEIAKIPRASEQAKMREQLETATKNSILKKIAEAEPLPLKPKVAERMLRDHFSALQNRKKQFTEQIQTWESTEEDVRAYLEKSRALNQISAFEIEPTNILLLTNDLEKLRQKSSVDKYLQTKESLNKTREILNGKRPFPALLYQDSSKKLKASYLIISQDNKQPQIKNEDVNNNNVHNIFQWRGLV